MGRMAGYVMSSLMTIISEATQNFAPTIGRDLYGSTAKPNTDYVGQFVQQHQGDIGQKGGEGQEQGGEGEGQEGEVFEITPLSGYAKHIEAIQIYARQSPKNLISVKCSRHYRLTLLLPNTGTTTRPLCSS